MIHYIYHGDTACGVVATESAQATTDVARTTCSDCRRVLNEQWQTEVENIIILGCI